MKNFIKRIILGMLVALMMIKNVVIAANVIDIGESSLIKRGDLGFYSIQYWSEARQKWMYITYSKTYYIDKQGNKRIAYCTDPDLDGVGWSPGEVEQYEADITKTISHLRLWRVYKNGYPFVTPQELGVETDEDAYLATKQAAYMIIRGKDASQVDQYYRVGQTEINEQSLADITRRGEKVISAIKKLVQKGNNGDEQMPKQSISKIDSVFGQDEKSEYYSEKMKINEVGGNSIYTITGIENAPEGTFIADMEGNPITNIREGQSFKVMVLKEKIDKNYNIRVNYSIDIQDYPVYYAKSKVSGMQNYVVIAEKNEIQDGYFGTALIANRSNIEIAKIDEESKEAIGGAEFNIKYENGENLGNFKTDDYGKIKLNDIKQGKLIITEISTLDEYELKEDPIEVVVEYGSTYNLEITNKHKKGSLEILKFDSEDNTKLLEGTEFDLIDSDGNVYKHMITDKNGKAFVEDVNIGEYTLRETKAAEGYKIGAERKIQIFWKEKLSIFAENEKQKGNIKIIKVDKDNPEVRIENVEFELLNCTIEKVKDFRTNENGEAEILDLPVGKYYVRETKGNENYVIGYEKIEIEVLDNETTEKIIENEKIKGKIKIIKTSGDYNKITKDEENTPISDVCFGVYDKNKNFIEEITTNENGEAFSSKLEKGTYFVKETEANEWYILDENYYEIEISKNEEIVALEVKNKSKDPEIDVEKTGPDIAKVNQEMKYTFSIKNIGNVELNNFTWYDFLPYEKATIKRIETGTYNQNLNYNIYYKTNKKQEFMVLNKELNTQENHYIDLTKIYLENDEKITQIKFAFGNVDIGFEQIEKPCIYMQINENLKDNTKLINETILEANYNNYKICDDATKETIIQNKREEIKKLPRTGF